MKIVDKGVLDPSYLDFTIPSDFARNHLYWVPQYGRFYCNQDYSIQRSYLDLFLFIYVIDGSLQVESRGDTFTAQKDQIVLLDCHYPHTYFCTAYADILWFHFNGNNSQAYTNYLFDKGIDKILKKLGEEATEIVIAAKNPNPEEIKYEISDFLYHMMVLMADRGITWEEITEELANR